MTSRLFCGGTCKDLCIRYQSNLVRTSTYTHEVFFRIAISHMIDRPVRWYVAREKEPAHLSVVGQKDFAPETVQPLASVSNVPCSDIHRRLALASNPDIIHSTSLTRQSSTDQHHKWSLVSDIVSLQRDLHPVWAIGYEDSIQKNCFLLAN